MIRFIKYGFIFLFYSLLTNQSIAQTPEQKLPEKTRILFLLDGSGSMLARWENTYRITVAKKLLSDFVDSLRSDKNLELALRIYGHQYDRRLKRCDDTKLEASFSANNHDRILNVLKNLGPKGTTPIAYALQQAANDFPEKDAARNIIIIITDGIESCDGDPCAVSLSLQRKGIFLKPFIIGIGMDATFEQQFGCMGSFYDAANINAFRKALNKVLFQSLGKTTASVELLDVGGNTTETDVNVSFINHFTQTSAFEFVHFRDENGKPDSVEIDPVLSYDIIVNTVPQVRKNKVELQAGEHNVINIKSPQGYLSIDQPGYTEYQHGVLTVIRKADGRKTLTTFNIPGEEKLLVGTYDIECNTLPRTLLKDVIINQSRRTSIILEQPGVINFVAMSKGIGSLYQIFDDGTQQWIYNLDPHQTRNTVTMQPGNYKIVFRPENAKGSKFTTIKEFKVATGSSFNIRL